jgi:hypothetical protein
MRRVLLPLVTLVAGLVIGRHVPARRGPPGWPFSRGCSWWSRAGAPCWVGILLGREM